MNLDQLTSTLKNRPDQVQFDDVIAVIDDHYTFSPTQFINGKLTNNAGENSGSCKIFAFAQQHQLSEQQTLHCFGEYYRKDVLNHPDENNHQNIRNFINTGWRGIKFSGQALQAK